MSGINGAPHPKGEEWSTPIGGRRGGCLGLLATAVVGLAAFHRIGRPADPSHETRTDRPTGTRAYDTT